MSTCRRLGSINKKIASLPNVSFNEYYGFFILTTYLNMLSLNCIAEIVTVKCEL